MDAIDRAAVIAVIDDVLPNSQQRAGIKRRLDALPSVTAGVKVDAKALKLAKEYATCHEDCTCNPCVLSRELIRIAEAGQDAGPVEPKPDTDCTCEAPPGLPHMDTCRTKYRTPPVAPVADGGESGRPSLSANLESISVGDVFRLPALSGGYRVWIVDAVLLGATSQESVIELGCLDRADPLGGVIRVPVEILNVAELARVRKAVGS